MGTHQARIVVAGDEMPCRNCSHDFWDHFDKHHEFEGYEEWLMPCDIEDCPCEDFEAT